MNLKWHLLYRITFTGMFCLLTCVAYLLYQTDQQARLHSVALAESLHKQLEFQLLRINTGIGQTNPFPDFELWKQNNNISGICISFQPAEGGHGRSLCNGEQMADTIVPAGFEYLYKLLFTPGAAITRPVSFNGRIKGVVSVTPSATMEIASAWEQIQALSGLSVLTIAFVCLLVYLNISRALRPAGIIVDGLARMQTGNLDWRLPAFEVKEWRQTAAAINQLAASQQLLLDERQRLAVRLMHLQEDERRFLCRELHDEFGQCLAAINAVAASIAQTAQQQCPDLIQEVSTIRRITLHMLQAVHGMLGRLRPAELDELGLASSLECLIRGWQSLKPAGTIYRLTINGDCGRLPEAAAMALYRITQECLTNISRHARAANASVSLDIHCDAACLTVADDGLADSLPFADRNGVGLIGIRERLAALHGVLELTIVQPHGLAVKIRLPLADTQPDL
ncbi:MAG: histidine kinase [Methylococcales bacterium]|nr:histidine kinase [Methylococcales bacterium]